jgi:hypothetical protein
MTISRMALWTREGQKEFDKKYKKNTYFVLFEMTHTHKWN